MTAPRPETIERRIKAALAAELRVVEIAPDGTIRLAERDEPRKHDDDLSLVDMRRP